jgi:transposase
VQICLWRAEKAGVAWPLSPDQDEASLEGLVYPRRPPGVEVHPTPDFEWVERELKRKHVTRRQLWREYQARYPEGLKYTAFCVKFQAWLTGMLGAIERQFSDPDAGALRFEERRAMLLQHELAERENTRFSQRLRIAALPQPACLEDLDTHIPTRHLDPAMLSTVRDLGWIARHLNVPITGPTGIGKSFIGAALAHAACRMHYHVRCFRLAAPDR